MCTEGEDNVIVLSDHDQNRLGTHTRACLRACVHAPQKALKQRWRKRSSSESLCQDLYLCYDCADWAGAVLSPPPLSPRRSSLGQSSSPLLHLLNYFLLAVSSMLP